MHTSTEQLKYATFMIYTFSNNFSADVFTSESAARLISSMLTDPDWKKMKNLISNATRLTRHRGYPKFGAYKYMPTDTCRNTGTLYTSAVSAL